MAASPLRSLPTPRAARKSKVRCSRPPWLPCAVADRHPDLASDNFSTSSHLQPSGSADYLDRAYGLALGADAYGSRSMGWAADGCRACAGCTGNGSCFASRHHASRVGGALLGGMVAGPIGAIAGGFLGGRIETAVANRPGLGLGGGMNGNSSMGGFGGGMNGMGGNSRQGSSLNGAGIGGGNRDRYGGFAGFSGDSSSTPGPDGGKVGGGSKSSSGGKSSGGGKGKK